MTTELLWRIAVALERQVEQHDDAVARQEERRAEDLARMANHRSDDLARIKREHAESRRVAVETLAHIADVVQMAKAVREENTILAKRISALEQAMSGPV